MAFQLQALGSSEGRMAAERLPKQLRTVSTRTFEVSSMVLPVVLGRNASNLAPDAIPGCYGIRAHGACACRAGDVECVLSPCHVLP